MTKFLVLLKRWYMVWWKSCKTYCYSVVSCLAFTLIHSSLSLPVPMHHLHFTTKALRVNCVKLLCFDKKKEYFWKTTNSRELKPHKRIFKHPLFHKGALVVALLWCKRGFLGGDAVFSFFVFFSILFRYCGGSKTLRYTMFTLLNMRCLVERWLLIAVFYAW